MFKKKKKKKKEEKKKAANNFKDLRSITLSFSSGVTCFVAEKGKGIKKFWIIWMQKTHYHAPACN